MVDRAGCDAHILYNLRTKTINSIQSPISQQERSGLPSKIDAGKISNQDRDFFALDGTDCRADSEDKDVGVFCSRTTVDDFDLGMVPGRACSL